MAALARPDTLLQQLEPAAGPYMNGNDTSIGGDETKTRYALEILRRSQPAFMTLHLSSLDDAQHAHGPFSAEACADLEAIDGMVARLARQEFAINPSRCRGHRLRSRIHEHYALRQLWRFRLCRRDWRRAR
jgi:predicted AlkP superfamily pyrophosphatase or phosphodiesterase